MIFNKNKSKKKRKVVGSIRGTQLITTFGPGAIVNLDKHSVMMAGTDYWKHSKNRVYHIREGNLEKQLGVEYFVLPKDSEDKVEINEKSTDIPAFIFPKILICSGCGKIANYKIFRKGKKLKCPNPKCNSDIIIPSRFVVACDNGHIDDFPYSRWVHEGENTDCGKNDLVMFNDKKSGGLESIVIKCNKCGRKKNMKDAFSKGAFQKIKYSCTRNRPWLNDYEIGKCSCTELKTAQRGGSNVYFGVHESALSIPPWSQKVQIELGKKDIWCAISGFLDDKENLTKLIKQYKIHERCKISVQEVLNQIKLKDAHLNNEEKVTRESIREDEYRAFVMGLDDSLGQFQTEEVLVPEFLSGYIKKVVLAKKLREVLALTDFNRITPQQDELQKKECSKLSKVSKKWYPAIELKGEGIFIQLDEEKIREWEVSTKINERYDKIKYRMESSLYKIRNLSPRYILLHTLAHLVIKQLILQCGYSTSAIKERIYSTFNCEDIDNPLDMCGILIYTATPDSEGSLGGLVSEGNPEKLENTFRALLEEASWCSSDPLCMQSNGQGMNNLNLAACHACALLPETSCEARNCYLDRCSIVGTLEDGEIGYFNGLLVK